jgi:hypothetical protein
LKKDCDDDFDALTWIRKRDLTNPCNLFRHSNHEEGSLEPKFVRQRQEFARRLKPLVPAWMTAAQYAHARASKIDGNGASRFQSKLKLGQ